MKKLLLLILFVGAVVASQAQKPIDSYTFYNFHGNIAFKGKLFLPVKDTTFTPDSMFSLTIRPQDSLPYVGIKTTPGGKRWVRFADWIGASTTGSSLDTTIFHSTNYHNTLYPRLSGSYANPSWITSLAFSKITGLQDSIQKLRDSINARLRTSQALIVDTTGASNGWEAYIKRTSGQPDTLKFREATGGSGGSDNDSTFHLSFKIGDELSPTTLDSSLVNSKFRYRSLQVFINGVYYHPGDTIGTYSRSGWDDSITIHKSGGWALNDKVDVWARDTLRYAVAQLEAQSGPAAPIAYVSSTNGGNNGGSGTTRTFAHTTGSGSNRYLLVGVVGDVTSGADDISSVTYAGVGMTLIAKLSAVNGGNRWTYLYGLANPTTGANNVVITASSSHYLLAASAEYSGVQGVDTYTTADAFTNSKTTSITTGANNCWTICLGATPGLLQNAGTGATKRVATTGDYCTFFDSNGAITPAGSYSMTTTSFSGSGIAHIIVSLKPF